MTVKRPGLSAVMGNLLLNCAAVAGLMCIVLLLLAVCFQITLVMFKTGSMSPTIPAGSLAVVQEIPASDITVGDVVTIDRAGQLPVTHRVVAVEGSGSERTVRMRGDANEAEDPAPYTVTEARRVLVSVPHLAHVVVWFSNPWVLGTVTLAGSMLVTWAFWPRRRVAAPEGRHSTRTVRAHGLGAAVGGMVLSGVALAAASPTPAEASPSTGEAIPVISRGAHVTLTSIGDSEAMRTMRPGIPVLWQVGVRVAAPEPGNVGVSLEASGPPELGLVMRIRGCTVPWRGEYCPETETPIAARLVLDRAEQTVPIAELTSTDEQWFLVSATIPEAAEGVVALTLRAAGGGDAISAAPGPISAMPTTGAGTGPLWLLGFACAVSGAMVAGLARVLQRWRSEGAP